MFLLRKLRPGVVIGFGGYVSLPLGLASALAGVPLVLHEQNAVPGLANRVLSRWARVVCVTYADAAAWLAHPERALVTGNPVRPKVAAADASAGRKALGLKKGDLVLLVFGGSRGARHLNAAILDLYSRLMELPKLQVVHVAGPLEIETVQQRLKEVSGGKAPRWHVHDYVDAMGEALAAADLVVCRAGATTLAELTLLGRAAVLVPFPFATEDHQTRNADALAAIGAASVIRDAELDTPAFGDEVLRLLGNARARKAMGIAAAGLARPLAAHAIAEAAMEEAGQYVGGTATEVSGVSE
jgi:UDP-N-acetylglucosamine--N-acetylmuramyl-(pentapeptide) pyrophosphoryl-undecaprenol N-acetylglucosamine transferase